MNFPLYHAAFEATESAIVQWGHEVDLVTGFEEEPLGGKVYRLPLSPDVRVDVGPYRPSYLGRIATMQAELYSSENAKLPSMIELTCEHSAATPSPDENTLSQHAYTVFQEQRRNFTTDLSAGSEHSNNREEDRTADMRPEDFRFVTFVLASVARNYPHMR